MSRSDTGPAPLDPRTDPDRWERVVHSIMTAAEPELRYLAGGPTPVRLITEWTRPVLAAAATVALLATGVLLRGPRPMGAAETVPLVADAIAPEPVAAWLVAGQVPTVEELVIALGGGTP